MSRALQLGKIVPRSLNVAQLGMIAPGQMTVRHSGHGHVEIPAKYAKLAKPATMDELYKPEGSWQEAYQIQNRRFNRNLALAVIALSGTIYLFTIADCIDPVGPPPMKNK